MNICVREAVLDDAEALAHVIVTATQATFRDLVPDACLSWLSENERASLHERAVIDGDYTAEILAAADEAQSAQNWRKSLALGLGPGGS